MLLADKIVYLRSMHGVCVVRNARGPGYWWANMAMGAKEALSSSDAAWLDAWKILEGW